VQGGVSGRSPKSNAEKHIGARMLVKGWRMRPDQS
jgi:hypothetical protein